MGDKKEPKPDPKDAKSGESYSEDQKQDTGAKGIPKSVLVSSHTNPKPPQPAESPLSALFSQLSLSEYLPAFEKEKYLPADLALLSTDELKELIPAAGPRKRLENWVKQQQLKPGAPPRAC